MDLLKHRFLLMPFWIAAFVFAADKLLLLGPIQEMTTSYMHIEHYFYDTREDLLRDLKASYDRRKRAGEKLGLIFGTSRSGEFDSHEIAKIIPGSYTYNFSAPQAGHSYHAYWLERILKSGIRPDFVMVESDPIALSPNANRLPIKHSFDLGFLLAHAEFNPGRSPWLVGGGFQADHFERFLLSRLFAAYRFPVNLRAAAKNREDILLPDAAGVRMTTGLEVRRAMIATIYQANLRNHGGIPSPHSLELPETYMQQDAEAMAGLHLPVPYHTGRAQTRLFREMLETLARESIPSVVFWPPVVARFRQIMDERGASVIARRGTQETLDRLRSNYPGAKLHFLEADSKGMKCRVFFDSIHLAGKCYPELTAILLNEIRGEVR